MTYPRPPKTGLTIILYIFGLALIIAAIIIVLKGAGVLSVIPGYVIWSIVLLVIGLGILSGLNSWRN